MHNKLLILIASLLLLGSSALSAAEGPVRIIAEEAYMDETRNLVRYTGSVVITQGDYLTARADQVLVNLNSERELQRMQMTGAPATLVSTEDDGYRASGLNLDYDLSARTLTMKDEAILIRSDQSLSGAHIVYHLDDKTVHASSVTDNPQANNPQRVEVLYKAPSQ